MHIETKCEERRTLRFIPIDFLQTSFLTFKVAFISSYILHYPFCRVLEYSRGREHKNCRKDANSIGDQVENQHLLIRQWHRRLARLRSPLLLRNQDDDQRIVPL